ncbi:Transcriptional regulatory protein pro1 [Fusarium oxysporum f. sp. albedinis]|nr:Transcriptional regulatory protein pro1 [Fusarium oxysporum f. sp. albedinis]
MCLHLRFKFDLDPSFSFAVPTVILELGYTAATAQLLTIPIYVCAMILATTLAVLSDRYKKRFPFLMVGLGVAAAGLISLLAIPRPGFPGLTYGFLFLAASGHYSFIVPSVCWLGNNLSPSSKRAVGMAVFMSLGNLGGIAGSNIFPEEEKPQYRTGYGCMQEDDGRFGYVSALLVEQLRSTPVRQVNIYISTDEVIRSQIGRPLLFNRSILPRTWTPSQLASMVQDEGLGATDVHANNLCWKDWVFFETRRRTKLVAYSFFNLHSIAYNIPPKLLNSEIGALNLPSPELHWRAETAEQWLAARKKDTFDEVSVQSAYKNLSTKANGRQSPALSSFGNYILIHRLVQQIFFARQSMILFDADDDAPLPPQAMERLESALCAWQRNWEATKDSSLDPLAPGGPLSFNATALFKLAYIRLHTDLGPYRRLETRDPGAIAQAFCTAPLLQRSTGVNRAVLHSAHSLSIPVRIGIEFVARTQTLHWIIVHSLCNLECGLVLAKWLQTIAHALARNEVLDDEETQLLRIITSIINETDLSPTIRNQENLLQKTKNMAAAVVRLWGYSFKGPHVFDIMGTIGAGLDLCAEIL